MKLEFSKDFEKQLKRLNQKQAAKTYQALRNLLENKGLKSLRYHPLRGEWLGCYSISAGGDLRIHVKYISDTVILVIAVGTHSQLYK